MILIGAPYLPKIAYAAETSRNENLRIAFQKSDMRSTFINTIGRAKDPKGRDRSIVYCFGIKGDEVNNFLNIVRTQGQDIEPPFVIPLMLGATRAEDFINAARLFLEKPLELWSDIQKDIAVLVAIIRRCKEENEVQCGEVIPHETELVQTVATKYASILEEFGIEIVRTNRGYRLQTRLRSG
jgi:biotin operon repressor